MKKIHYVLSIMLSVTTALTSCLGEGSSEVSLYDDAVITSFTLGTLTQYEPGTNKVAATLTGTNYPMSIDQINGKIFNRTPLPTGTRIDSVLCTVGTLNNGIVGLQNLTDDQFLVHSSSNAVDFQERNPRIFRVISSDASFYRDYTVTLNVAASSGSNFTWGAAVADTALLRDFTDMRLMLLKQKRLVALCGNGTNTLVRFSDDNGTTWHTPATTTALADSAWASAVVKDSTLFLFSDGLIYSTDNGEEWNSTTAAPQLKQLVATSKGELFALCKDSTLQASADNGSSWVEQRYEESLKTDSVKRLLGLTGIASTAFDYPASYHTDYVLLVGNNGSKSVVWRKLSHYDPVKATDTWTNIATESINRQQLPAQQRLTLLYFDDMVMAIGDGLNVYQSKDQGITWNINTIYALPETMLTATIDGTGRLCAIGKSGKVYRGLKY